MSECDLQALILQQDQTAPSSWYGRQYFLLLWKLLEERGFTTRARFGKRLFDVVFSAVGLLVLSPILIVIVLFIRFEDGGPALFVQRRIGKGGREFKIYKFRSMCMDAEQQLDALLQHSRNAGNITFKIMGDPRVTRVGKWLRRYSLDELPQLWNVLKGEMSLVGPRPPLPREVALYSPFHHRRLSVEPGITCYWQISGRSDLHFSIQVQMDLQYIEEQTLLRDLWILLKTVPAVLAGRGAY